MSPFSALYRYRQIARLRTKISAAGLRGRELGKVLRQRGEHLVSWDAKGLRELLNMLIADHRLELILADRKLSAVLRP